MKVSTDRDTAAKLAQALEGNTNPQVRAFVAKLEHGLQPGVMLTADELAAVVECIGRPVPLSMAGLLASALPKLEQLRERTAARERGEA